MPFTYQLDVTGLSGVDSGKIITADAAVRLIRDCDTIATGGFAGIGFAENIAVALEERFLASKDASVDGFGSPQNLTLVFAADQGDGKSRGLNHLGHDGLVGRVIGGGWSTVPRLRQLAVANRIAAWSLPQGVISHLYRDIAAGKPGTLTRIGLGTFVDPRHGGGRLNEKATNNLVSLMEIDDEKYLFYKAFPINVGIIRGTTADSDGNITMDKEALILEAKAIAMAAHNSGGIVIAQVERIAARGSLKPQDVQVPGILVDCIVVAEKPEYHHQTYSEHYHPAFSGELRVPPAVIPSMPMSLEKIIARRAAMELFPNSIVNLGAGISERVASIAVEERVIDQITLTGVYGSIGGYPAGKNFGVTTNAQAFQDQPSHFDFTDGGGIDIAFLSLGQVDSNGNVNVSKFGPRLVGASGFINISQSARKVVFTGLFASGAMEVAFRKGNLHILRDGKVTQFVEAIEHRTFSSAEAHRLGTTVLYITERCVFRSATDGLELIEIAPGVDLQRDILDKLSFAPILRCQPALMDERIFHEPTMDIRLDIQVL